MYKEVEKEGNRIKENEERKKSGVPVLTIIGCSAVDGFGWNSRTFPVESSNLDTIISELE